MIRELNSNNAKNMNANNDSGNICKVCNKDMENNAMVYSPVTLVK